MTPEDALAALEGVANPENATEMARYHKVPRRYLGVPNPVVDGFVKDWRAALDVPGRVALADGLWQTDVHEARVAAAKLLTQARLRPDDTPAWELIASWVPSFDAWATADHACIAGQKRLVWEPSRLDQVRGLDHLRSHVDPPRRALVMTLPLDQAKQPQTGRAGGARADPGMGGKLRQRPRVVHPKGGRLVAARAVQA